MTVQNFHPQSQKEFLSILEFRYGNVLWICADRILDVWLIGKIMYQLITHEFRLEDKGRHPGPCNMTEKLAALPQDRPLFFGPELYSKVELEKYSEELRGLVLECILPEAIYRPTSVDLQTRTQTGLEKWNRTAKSPLNLSVFNGIPRKPFGSIPPLDWALIDDTTINIMIKVYTSLASDFNEPWFIFIFDLPQSMSIGLLKNQIEAQMSGSHAREENKENTTRLGIDTASQVLWYRNFELEDDETIESVGLKDMETVACFHMGSPPEDLTAIKTSLNNLNRK